MSALQKLCPKRVHGEGCAGKFAPVIKNVNREGPIADQVPVDLGDKAVIGIATDALGVAATRAIGEGRRWTTITVERGRSR